MRKSHRPGPRMTLAAAWVAAAVWWAPATRAGEEAVPAESSPEAAAPGGETLGTKQEQIAEQFRHLEEVLARMAELTAVTDPDRAALVRRAVAMSKDRLIGTQLEAIERLLAKESLARALENQEAVQQDLNALLQLLVSENRGRRIESEKARIRRYLKELNRLIKQQKSIQGRTAGPGDPGGLADEQGELADQTGRLAQEVKENEESGPETAEGESGRGDDQPGDGQRGTGQGGESGSEGEQGAEGGPGEPKEGVEGDAPQGGSKPAEGSGEPAEGPQEGAQGQGGGPPQESPPGQGQGGSGGEGQPSPAPAEESEAHPARRRLEAARQRMRQAQRKLEEAQREGAVEEQEEAIRQLEEAKAELERILRQLREEEIQRVLAMLEQRFLKMLDMQREVYEGTKRLDAVPGEQRDRNHQIEASRLSRRESEIVLEADKAWNLLKEDGTAVAFPEAVQQMRDDMEQVVQRLARDDVGEITQGIEEDIIAALEEMIEALQQAIRDAEDRRQPLPNMPMPPQDPALVDVLAELKMIRALQMRVNRRTDRYSQLIEGEQADSADLLEALDRLAEREARIYRITRDLQLGKNR